MAGVNYTNFEKVMQEIEELSKRKNHDYGCDSLTRFGNFGIAVIMLQKMDRLKTFYDKDGKLKVDDEKLEDTLKDIVNYAIYMILQERKQLVDKESVDEVKVKVTEELKSTVDKYKSMYEPHRHT